LVAGALGALIGYYRECTDGSCPLHPTWWKGAIFGTVVAVIGVVAVRIIRRNDRKKTT
jgi:hypothetical protein